MKRFLSSVVAVMVVLFAAPHTVAADDHKVWLLAQQHVFHPREDLTGLLFQQLKRCRYLIRVDGVEQSLAMIQSVLDNQPGPALDIVCLNAGAAIYVSGLADSHRQGVEMARQAIADGKARDVLQKLIDRTNG